MAWFGRAEKSEAQQSLERLQQGMTASPQAGRSGSGARETEARETEARETEARETEARETEARETEARETERELFVELTRTPSARTAGTPLACYNQGDTLWVGDRVDLCTTLRGQTTTVMAIVRDGRRVESFDFEQTAEVVLADDVDLSDVYRSSCLQDAGVGRVGPEDFRLEIRTAEQQGRHTYVTGPALGPIEEGATVVVTPWHDVDRRTSRVRRVDRLPDGTTGLLLARRDAAPIEYGDQVSAFPGLTP